MASGCSFQSEFRRLPGGMRARGSTASSRRFHARKSAGGLTTSSVRGFINTLFRSVPCSHRCEEGMGELLLSSAGQGFPTEGRRLTERSESGNGEETKVQRNRSKFFDKSALRVTCRRSPPLANPKALAGNDLRQSTFFGKVGKGSCGHPRSRQQSQTHQLLGFTTRAVFHGRPAVAELKP